MWRGGTVRTIDVTKVAAGIDAVADNLLQVLGLRETAVALALLDQLAIEVDFKDAAGTWDKRDLAHFE